MKWNSHVPGINKVAESKEMNRKIGVFLFESRKPEALPAIEKQPSGLR